MENSIREFHKSFIPAIKARHKKMTGRECDLENPRRFTDKLEWLKVYDSTYLKTFCADKLTAKLYVANKLGANISIPVLGIWNSFDDIDFDALPANYVLKTNHGSHTNIVVKDGNIDRPAASIKFAEWLSKDWSWWGYELHYIPIQRKIFAEEYKSDGAASLLDYKFFCFNGNPILCTVVANRNAPGFCLNYYDTEWNPCTHISRTDIRANYDMDIKKPANFERMKKLAAILSSEFKFVRVDFYEIGGEVYFGELTFIPGAAYFSYTDDAVDYELGDMLKLD